MVICIIVSSRNDKCSKHLLTNFDEFRRQLNQSLPSVIGVPSVVPAYHPSSSTNTFATPWFVESLFANLLFFIFPRPLASSRVPSVHLVLLSFAVFPLDLLAPILLWDLRRITTLRHALFECRETYLASSTRGFSWLSDVNAIIDMINDCTELEEHSRSLRSSFCWSNWLRNRLLAVPYRNFEYTITSFISNAGRKVARCNNEYSVTETFGEMNRTITDNDKGKRKKQSL